MLLAAAAESGRADTVDTVHVSRPMVRTTVLALIIHATGSSSCIFCVNIKALFARDDDDAMREH